MNSNNIKLPSNHKKYFLYDIYFFRYALQILYKDILILYFSFFLIFLIFLLLTIIKPKKLHILNKVWMKFFILGKFISPIILGIIFFGLFFPISIIFKLTKRDELKIVKVKNESLWKYRKVKTNFSKQFKFSILIND